MPRIRHRRGQYSQVGQWTDWASRRETPTSAARELGNCIYAVRTPDGLIKIGYTSNLDGRIRQFGSRWADVLLALPGSLDSESELHIRFKPYLARGREYYFPCAEILDWVNGERDRLGVSAGFRNPHICAPTQRATIEDAL